MESRSGLFKAGEVLLLVGAILSAVGAVFLVLASIGLGALFASTDTGDAPTGFITAVYGVLAAVLAMGAVFGFLAYGKARRGDAHGGFVFGLVAALLPPVQVVPLLGAIFCKVSPEGEAARSAVPPQAP